MLSTAEPYGALSRLLDLARVKGCELEGLSVTRQGGGYEIRVRLVRSGSTATGLLPLAASRLAGIAEIGRAPPEARACARSQD